MDRLTKKAKRQDIQIERLTRMLLLQRIKDADIDFSQSLDVLDNYRPEYDSVVDFDNQFSPEAVQAWLEGRESW